MNRTFSSTLADLRRRNGYSQRKVAGDLHISQALLSHYENGAREPGLEFVCKACDYYGVTADFLLCRSDDPVSRTSGADAARAFIDELKILTNKAETALEEFK